MIVRLNPFKTYVNKITALPKSQSLPLLIPNLRFFLSFPFAITLNLIVYSPCVVLYERGPTSLPPLPLLYQQSQQNKDHLVSILKWWSTSGISGVRAKDRQRGCSPPRHSNFTPFCVTDPLHTFLELAASHTRHGCQGPGQTPGPAMGRGGAELG